jgi:hypothetical protein
MSLVSFKQVPFEGDNDDLSNPEAIYNVEATENDNDFLVTTEEDEDDLIEDTLMTSPY